jgi:hypothetical protein
LASQVTRITGVRHLAQAHSYWTDSVPFLVVGRSCFHWPGIPPYGPLHFQGKNSASNLSRPSSLWFCYCYWLEGSLFLKVSCN